MAQIKPLNIWHDGQTKQAEQIDIHSNFDDLKTTATFYYCLKDATGNKIVDGNVTIDGEKYENWDGSNAGALNAVSEILNISYL